MTEETEAQKKELSDQMKTHLRDKSKILLNQYKEKKLSFDEAVTTSFTT